MSRKWLLFLVCLLVMVALAPLSHAELTLKVNEKESRILFEDQGTRVLLAVQSPFAQRLDAVLNIELVDTNGGVRATAAHDVQIKPGRNELSAPIDVVLTGKNATDTRELLWYRLRYRLAPASSARFAPIDGVISMSQITPDIFVLQVASSQKAQEGSTFRLRVQAKHPLTSQAVAGVTLSAEMKFDGSERDDVVLKQNARTDTDGFATLDFQIPRQVEDDEADLSIEGRRGILVQTAESEVDLNREAQVMVTTDKPLYQPGQTLHVRVLMFDGARHAIANGKATLKIEDPEDATVFRSDLTTSRFGVASADWEISDNTRLGDYRVEVELESDRYSGRYGGTMVKLSRYDLPNFTVNVKPDRSFYLPHQDAQIEVRADYLFGQPVKRGHVRVVRETERRWNYREQKWETEEGDKYEGETDGDGKFVAKIKLEDEHEELDDDDYSRYKDLTYAAYFTDPATNRTEQRRFDLRLTKDAIHVYVVTRASREGRGLPIQFYVSTSYADGSPASCDVAISHPEEEDDSRNEPLLQIIKTNSYGLAKVSSLTLPNSNPEDTDSDRLLFRFRATDNKGGSGVRVEKVYRDDRPAIRVETAKSLFRDGEAIRAEIIANKPDEVVAVDVLADKTVLQSQMIRLQQGRASLTIPYRREFDGVVTIAAYLSAEESYTQAISAARAVLYPHNKDLKFNLTLNQESYRPGEDASASFLTRLANGRAAQSALGVVIFDRAVEERARTDRDFGGSYGFYDAYCYLAGYDNSVGGVSRRDLDQIDLSKPLADGLDLVAEVLLSNSQFEPHLFRSQNFDQNGAQVFAGFFAEQIDPLKKRLDSEYKDGCTYPTDVDGLRRLALLSAINFDNLRDPWETPYQTLFYAERSSSVLQMISAGADRQFDTDDDFTVLQVERPYFRFTGEAINRALVRYHTRTGSFIRDASTLKTELQREAIDFDALRDPWGQPYELSFGISQTKLMVNARSSGPDRQFAAKSGDDVWLWTASIDYTREVQAKIDLALTSHFRSNSQIPQNETDFRAAMSNGGVTQDELRDPWGHAYYATFKQDSVYGNRINIYNQSKYGEKPTQKTELTPVTQQVNYIYVRSAGEDGKEGTSDDFNVGSFSRIVAEQGGRDRTPKAIKTALVLPGSLGAIMGTVVDPAGAVVAGANVTAKNSSTEVEYPSETTDNGIYLIKNLPSGIYRVTIDARGFKRSTITDVVVRSSSITELNVALEVGTVSETVTVTGEASTVNTLNATVSSKVTNNFTLDGVANSRNNPPQLSTPRLREYFPETLVWQPSLETDKQGRAQLKFKLADNITTWKMSVIASTEDGQIGTIEKDIKSFQPFFVEHDPPRILTEGDEISLPVVVRNYLDRKQPISLEIKPENWFSVTGPSLKRAEVAPGDAVRETFDLRATASVKDGKQRLTALGADANDAIEKPVTVHPDGEEKSVSASDVVADNSTLLLDVPASAIPGSTRAELKIYPNLMAHVVESIEAIMKRPYGCGEQTISSTYPSLLLLRHYKQMTPTGDSSSVLRGKAERYLRAGYHRLLNYRDENGGFTYWGHGDPDVALTAYALRFLNDAKQIIAVDDDVIDEARAWLIKQQHADGSWGAYDYGSKNENTRRTAMLTAYVLRVLAMTSVKPEPAVLLPEQKRALDYLAARSDEWDEPYLIASYALAAFDLGDTARAAKPIARLSTLAHDEKGTAFWLLESNTPFYGWGLAGRVETTAIAIQALARAGSGAGGAAGNDQLVNRGLLFLLREKDTYGVWYSTQATINVLDAMLVLLARDGKTTGSTTAEVIMNGRPVKSVVLPPPNQLVTPITIDLSQFTQRGPNRIELRKSAGSSPASAQAVATYYVPWRESIAMQEAAWRALGSSGLRLVAKFDKTEGRISDEITCHVEAERIGSRGYGMMLAEIGLPPGADVDRASLEKAIKESDWGMSQYDVLPDRLIVYLWPRAGGTKFDFKFKPRFGMNAQTAASTIYDYYNPEARAVVAPARFVVK